MHIHKLLIHILKHLHTCTPAAHISDYTTHALTTTISTTGIHTHHVHVLVKGHKKAHAYSSHTVNATNDDSYS